MGSEPEIRKPHIFINKDLEELLFNISDERKEKNIHIIPFNRYGKSGSNLYLIYFSEEAGNSLPYLLKTFEDEKKFNLEKNGMEQIKKFYRYAHFTSFPGRLSGILLEEHNIISEKVNNPKTLKDIMYKEDENNIGKIIEKAFKDFHYVYKSDIVEDCDIKDQYSWYLRDNRTKDIIANHTVDSIQEKKIEFYRQKITNPVYILDNLRENTEITKSLIHGDFHPSNIVIDDNNDPRIVDFAWSGKNDIYIDFSLLEMSVRYWNSPALDYKTKNEIEKIFLHENIIDYVDKYKGNAQRMIIIVSEIRKWCKEYTKEKYNFKHHLLSQFIILYGLQAYTDSYNPFLVIPFLAKLGDKLIQSGYVNSE